MTRQLRATHLEALPQPVPLLRTKLHRPPVDDELVSRKRLEEAMDRGLHTPLTLVSAPAGYGKSILVSQWAERREGLTAWLSLDDSDSEARTFLQYFLAAVDTVSPGACPATRELLAAPTLPPVPVAAGYLLNDLDAMDAPCAIVLDDYHRIDPLSPVNELMARVLEHPPRQIHLVIITRRDPPLDLTSLRAGNRINEVRLQDLRFTEPETVEFLAKAAELAISEKALAGLQREVEGWAVGLRLVSLALRRASDPDAFLKGLHGGLPHTQEYLLREVLGTQVPEVQDRLLASSILDRFCAEVLDAICEPAVAAEQPGLTARDFVEELGRSNLFTIALDARGEWFRYHHLFQELLNRELQRVHGPEHVAALHVRASEWFEAESLIDEALKHALAAEDVERAVQLVARHRHPTLDADRWYVLGNWLSLMPEAVVEQHAELLMTRAWLLMHHFRFETVLPLLDRVESLLADDSAQEPLRGELALCRGYSLFFLGEGAGSLKNMTEALERIPVSHYEARAQSEVIFALSSQMVGQKEQAIRGLDDLLAHYDSPEELRKTRLLITYVFIHFIDGDLVEAELANRRLREVVERGGYAYARAWSAHMQGLIHLHRGEWEAAVEHLGRSVEQRFIHFSRAAVDSITGLMLACQALGRQDEVQATMQVLQDYVASLDDPGLQVLAGSAEARLAIMQGRPELATRWLEAIALPPEGAMLWWLDVPSVTRCRALIAEGSPGSLAEAEARLREYVETNEAHHNTFQMITIATLLVMACEKQGKTEEALGFLERAVTMARQGGLVSPFLELGPPMTALLRKLPRDTDTAPFVERILSASGNAGAGGAASEMLADGQRPQKPGTRRVAAQDLLDDLTHRELDVLELLAQRLQDKEIAAQLSISVLTVKDHLKHIYRKLDVHGRRQAVRRASELGLLGAQSSGRVS